MLRINGEFFYRATVAQNTFRQMVEGWKDEDTPPINQDTRDNLRVHTLVLDGLLEMLGAKVTCMANRRLLALIDSEKATYADLAKEMWEVNSRLRDELSSIHLFCIAEAKVRLYEPTEPLFGRSVADSFPSSSYDIEEAGKCLALRRSTACVAHLMRALEPPLACLARALNVPFEHQNWHNILDQVEKAIRSKGEGSRSSGWKQDEQFFSEAAAHFRLLKDAWRNHTMHLRDKYDEERAEVIFTHVRIFMRHLTERLSEERQS